MTTATVQKIEKLLRDKFQPVYLEIQDDSARHKGHSGVGHYSVVIVSKVFEGLSLLEQHRRVKEALRGLWGLEIHALQLKTLSRLGDER